MPAGGYHAPPGATPTSAQLARPLTVERNGSRITISFNAPVAVSGAGNAYVLESAYAGAPRCRQLRGMQSTDRDIAAGAAVTLTITIPRFCHGRVRGTVRLSTAAASAVPKPRDGSNPWPVVGTFSVPGA